MAGKGRRGPARAKLDQPQRDRLIALIGEGHGRVVACRIVGVSYKTLARRMAEDEALREQVKLAEQTSVEDFMKRLYDLHTHENPFVALAAIKAYLGQFWKVREARSARKAKVAAGRGQAELAGFIPRLADAILGLVPEDRHAELTRRLDGLTGATPVI